MNRNYFKWIVIVAAAGIVLMGVFMLTQSDEDTEPLQKSISQPFSPFKSYISALGIVEASGGNIYIGSPVNRVVDEIEVKVGQKVKKGEVLFRLDSSDLEAELSSRSFNYENAKANLRKLEALPRSEDIESSTAQLKSAQVEFDRAKSQYERVKGLENSGAMSQEDVSQRRYAFEDAEARLQMAQSALDKVKAGSWPPDLEIARLQVMQSKALVERVEADIERTVIRSPTDATILQIKIHEGEFPPSDSSVNPPMIIGNTDKMYLRVSINQFDAPLYDPKSKAIAYVQGNSNIGFPLKFVHIEPFLVTKQNITNEITEKVDTRVLQALYSFEEGETRVFIGQQMNVFIETPYTAIEGNTKKKK